MSAPGTAESTEAIARARAGDAEAWGELYRDYAPAIFRFCRRALPTRTRRGRRHDGSIREGEREIAPIRLDTPVFLVAVQGGSQPLLDLLRRRKIRQDKETEDVETVPLEHPDANQLEQLIEKRTSEEVRKALDKLPARARMALVLRYYSDMSYDEIADELGCGAPLWRGAPARSGMSCGRRWKAQGCSLQEVAG